jgi:hypothetical protein
VRIRGLAWIEIPSLAQGKFGCATAVLTVTGVYFAVGVVAFVAWRITGDFQWVGNYFRTPGALLAVFLAATELYFSRRVLEHFSPGEPMRKAWACIAASAAFDFAGTLLVQVLSKKSPLNPLRLMAWWTPDTALAIGRVGTLMGGTCRFSILALGLWFALRAYRRSGLMGRLNAINWLALAAMAVYIVVEMLEIRGVLHSGKPVPIAVMAGWPVDPFLWLLLAQASLLYRSSQQMGPGWVTRCWNSMAVGVFLVLFGDVAQWASNWGYLPWPWSSLVWYIWPLAAAAFALAPVYQLEAIQRASAAD